MFPASCTRRSPVSSERSAAAAYLQAEIPLR